MPNCDFYALGQDAIDVVRFVFSQPGWALHELSSEPDHELRCFSSEDALLRAFDLSSESAYLQLHAPEMGGRVYARRVDFDEHAVAGASFRYESQGWGLVQLYLQAPHAGRLRASHTNHNSESRARAWEPTYADEPDRVEDWDWRAVGRISGRLNRFIRSRAVSKSNRRAVLPCAHDAASRGLVQLSL